MEQLLLSIYFPTSWMELGILLLGMILLSFLIKKILWVGGKKNDIDAAMIFLFLAALTILWLIVAKGIPEISKWFAKKPDAEPGSKTNGFTVKPWMWLGAIGLLLLFLFRNKLRRIKRPTLSSQWWVGIMFGLLGFYILNKEVLHLEMPSWLQSNRPSPKSSQSTYVDPLTLSPLLNKNGPNEMVKGKFFQIANIRRGDPSISFFPTDPQETILYFRKTDPTQNWRLRIWTDVEGIIHKEYIPYEPTEDLYLGTLYVACENRSATVKVLEKKKK